MELTVGLVTLVLVAATWGLGRLASRLEDPERNSERRS